MKKIRKEYTTNIHEKIFSTKAKRLEFIMDINIGVQYK